MFSKEVVVHNQVGLHARPATFFIQKANEFKSSIWVEKEERKVNGWSIHSSGSKLLGSISGTLARKRHLSAERCRFLFSWERVNQLWYPICRALVTDWGV